MWAQFCFELKNRFSCITTVFYSLLSYSGSGVKQWVIHIKYLHRDTWGLISLPTWQDPVHLCTFNWNDLMWKKTMISVIKTCLRGIYSCHWNSENTKRNVRFYSIFILFINDIAFSNHMFSLDKMKMRIKSHPFSLIFSVGFLNFFTLFAWSVERGGIDNHFN